METATTTPADAEHHHYDWGASGSKTWIGCYGSMNFVRQKKAEGLIPLVEEEKDWTVEGSRAHHFSDEVLKGNIEREEVPPEFYEHLEGYIDLAEELAETVGGTVYHEQQVPYFYEPSETGTLDYGVVSEDLVAILDLKYGVGVYVTAYENTQGAIYAISLMKELEAEGWEFTEETRVQIYIYQPRHRDFDGVPEVWEVSYRELLDMAIDIEDHYQKSLNASPEDLTPGKEQCKFCPGRSSGACTAKTMQLFEDVPDEINPLNGDLDFSDEVKEGLTPENIIAIYEKRTEIVAFMNDVLENARQLIQQGVELPGLKVVKGKEGNRKWGENEHKAETLLRKIPAKIRYKKRLLSPAQAEGVLKKLEKEMLAEDEEAKPIQTARFKNRFKELIVRPAGKPKLALESEEGESIKPTSEVFDDVSDDVGEDDCF